MEADKIEMKQEDEQQIQSESKQEFEPELEHAQCQIQQPLKIEIAQQGEAVHARTSSGSGGNSHGTSSSQNVCAHCGRESVDLNRQTNQRLVMDPVTSTLLVLTLPSQEAAKIRKQEAAAQSLMHPTEEEAAEWIYCDVCHKWFHALCVELQQYELSLIDKYHCPSCRFEHGDSIMKVKRLNHRYAFDDEAEQGLPVQIGTEAWTQSFKERYLLIPEATAPEIVKIYENGTQLMNDFNFNQCWTLPIKVLNQKGLGLRMPDNPDFDVIDVLKLLGGHVTVDTIDVFAQQSYTMSLDRFFCLWRKRTRDRLYNILSLEFSETKLAEIVKSPQMVRDLSWVQRFWQNNDYANEGGEAAAKKPDDIYAFNDANSAWTRPSMFTHEQDQQRDSARPYVEHFCLMGMRGSYTDFHIDFGGSSVWYHVFKGEKVFFIARPSVQNLEAFLRWQKDARRSEIFFEDMLPPGEKLFRLHVRERETLFLPSGWIHSVYTPEDSLVFGGNFLHNLNVPMQLKIYDMEGLAETEERFKFPYFELCNFYAAKSIAGLLEDSTAEGKLADQVLLDAAQALVSKCTQWIRAPGNKFAMFNGTVKQLQREFERQMGVQRRLMGKLRPSGSSTPHLPEIDDSATVASSSSLPSIESHGKPPKRGRLDTQDLDTSWEEVEGEDDEEMREQQRLVQNSNYSSADDEQQPSTSSQSRRKKRSKVLVTRRDLPRDDSVHSDVGAVVEIESDGPVKLKIKLPPCWRRPTTPPLPKHEIKRATKSTEFAAVEEDLDVNALFTGRSTHGRKLRPSARIADIVEQPGQQENTKGAHLMVDAISSDGQQSANDADFLATVKASGGHKGFMAQFTAEERRQIELAEKAAELDEHGELESPLLKKIGSKKKVHSQQRQKKRDSVEPATSSEQSQSTPVAAEKKPKKSGLDSRQRLAKKLGLMRKK